MHRILSVDVSDGTKDDGRWTIERSLGHFFQDETREVNCEKCKEGKTATQTMKIVSS